MAIGYVFDEMKIAVRDDVVALGSGTFYMALVTAVPAVTITFASSLTPVVGGSYAPFVLTGASRPATLTSGRAILTFANPTFMALHATAATAVVGFVVVKQMGGAIVAGSDRVLSFTPLTVVNAAAAIASCTTYSGFRALTAADGTFTDVRLGSAITGAGIQASTTVIAVSGDGGTLIMSLDATASAAVTVTTTTDVLTTRAMPTTVGAAVDLAITIPSSTGVFSF